MELSAEALRFYHRDVEEQGMPNFVYRSVCASSLGSCMMGGVCIHLAFDTTKHVARRAHAARHRHLARLRRRVARPHTWVALPPVRRVFFFASPLPPITFADIARALRSSLAAVLPAFHPFAGELVYSPESRAVAIVCGDGAGVEAETRELEFARLVEAEGAEHELEALGNLVPDIRRDELPTPVMAVQVTEFVSGGGRGGGEGWGGGGVALGVAVHHAVADRHGILQFLEAWAVAVVQGKAVEPVPPPAHDRSLVRFHGDEELAGVILRHCAPDLPRPADRRRSRAAPPGVGGAAPPRPAYPRRRGAELAAASPTMAAQCTRSSSPTSARTCPRRPPVPAAYAGNCVVPCSVALGGAELAGAGGHARALAAIGAAAVVEVRRDPLANRGRWGRLRDAPPGRAVILAGSPWFAAYAMDFGFGRPVWSEMASMNHDGEIFLVAGREAGSVQASVAVDAGKMPAFREMFVLDSSHKSGDGCSRL
ncbi:unnamed protein product [Urochloa decumbens]|uniref:Uncharacterized protein n=1 Tax=Urochloa decumbens TaxID=240449 RepID=A0ABC8YH12_9POAL